MIATLLSPCDRQTHTHHAASSPAQIPFSNAMRRAVVQRKALLSTASKAHEKELMAFKSLARETLKAPMNAFDGIRFFDGSTVPKEGS